MQVAILPLGEDCITTESVVSNALLPHGMCDLLSKLVPAVKHFAMTKYARPATNVGPPAPGNLSGQVADSQAAAEVAQCAAPYSRMHNCLM
jgi:hypothetical protein